MVLITIAGHPSARAWGVTFIGEGWRPWVLQAHSLLVNLKHKSVNLRVGRGTKKQEAQMVSNRNQLRPKTKEPQRREAAWLCVQSFG